MMRPSRFVSRAGLVISMSLASQAGARADQRAPVVETVDLVVPVSPTTVAIAGRTTIVHELHITNFLPVDIAIRRVQVVSGDRSAALLADYREEGLRGRIGRPGLPRDHDEPDRVGPGMRAIVYFWIELAADPAAPSALRHRVEMDIQRPAGPVRAVVEGAVSTVSKEKAVALAPPLRGGPWTAIYDPSLKGGHRTVTYAIEGRARIPGRFAIDWVRLPASGALERPPAVNASDWNGLGSEVLAVADAVVAAAMDDVPDKLPSSARSTSVALQDASGNYVVLDLGRGRFAFYEHLKHGSVAVRKGDRVRTGQSIARLGNSGSSSIGPHLHFHVADAESPLGAEGLPFVFTTFEHLGRFTSIEALTKGEAWQANAGGQTSVRRLERPIAMSVVRFQGVSPEIMHY